LLLLEIVCAYLWCCCFILVCFGWPFIVFLDLHHFHRRCYLEPLGIPRDALFSLSADDVTSIKAANPTLADEAFILPVAAAAADGDSIATTTNSNTNTNDARPYAILGGTLCGPSSLNPFATNKTYVPLEFAALGVGAALTQVVPYASAKDPSVAVPVKVGGLVAPFAWGLAQAPGPGVPVTTTTNASSGQGQGSVPSWMPAINGSPKQRLSLSRAAGISSMAAEGLLSQLTGSTLLLVDENVWPVDEPSDTEAEAAAAALAPVPASSSASSSKRHGGGDDLNFTSMLVGDGGLMENFGVFAALRRRVPRLAVSRRT
jgi:hypothetical protein